MSETNYPLNHLVVNIHVVLNKITYPGWEDVRNLVNVHSLYWIYEGKGSFLTNSELQVEKGMLAYLKPGLKMSMRSEADAPLRIIMILFDCALFQYETVWKGLTPLEKLNLPFLSRYHASQALELHPLFEEIFQVWNAGASEDHGLVHPKLQLLLHKLHQHEKPDWQLTESGAIAAYEQIKQQLEMRFKENLHIHTLAKQHNISVSYLRKLFMKHTGLSAKAYLNDLRNQQACRYLTYTDYSVREIAKLSGYVDEYHFSKMFKQLNGLSPSAYRSSRHYSQ